MLFKDDYFFLSNFYPCDVKVEIEDKTYIFKNAEAAYQAHKNPKLAEKFLLLSGAEAKKLGQKIPITVDNWKVERVYAMAKVLNNKFKNVALLFYLRLIKDEIVEDNYWNDIFWGVCSNKKYDHVGKNVLGKLLMNIRDHNNDYNYLLAYINKDIVKLCIKED